MIVQLVDSVGNKWTFDQPTPEVLDYDTTQAAGTLQAHLSPVDTSAYAKQGKEIVRMYFRDHFGQEDYKVDIWQRIKDVTGKGRVSDSDVPTIDGLNPGEVPLDWGNLTEEQRKEELKKLFPNLFEVP